MKTVTLTEEAYRRLLVWKTSPRDSFSKVVLRVVPPKYSGAAILEAIESLPPLSDQEEEELRTTLSDGRDWEEVRDPWNS